MQLVGIRQLPSEVAVSLHWKSSFSRLWKTREASLFKLDLSGWTTCSRDPNLELVAFCYITHPWRELFIFFCWSFHFLTVLPRIWLWYLHLKINSDPIIWHVSPYRERNYQERNNKGSSTKQLLTKYLFHFLTHLFIKHFLSQALCQALGMQKWTASCLLGAHSPVGWQTTKQGNMLCWMSYANCVCKVSWDPGRVACVRAEHGRWKEGQTSRHCHQIQLSLSRSPVSALY